MFNPGERMETPSSSSAPKFHSQCGEEKTRRHTQKDATLPAVVEFAVQNLLEKVHDLIIPLEFVTGMAQANLHAFR